jgi:Cu/Ag efflux protein CusF
MMNRIHLSLIITALFLSACGGGSPSANHANHVNTTPKPAATQTKVENGDYPGKGKITKIDTQIGSVEMNHEEIVGVMPAMLMEFYVSDKKMLDGLKVGDAVDFTLRYKDSTETVVAISKAK